MPGIVVPHIDHVAGDDGTAIHFVSQLDAPDDVPPWSYPSQREDCPFETPSSGVGARLKALANWAKQRASRLDACDAIQCPFGLIAECGIVCGRDQRLSRNLCLGPDASERLGADANVEELILQSFDQLRHSHCAAGPMPARASPAAHRTPGTGSLKALARSLAAASACGPMDANASAA